MEVELMSKFKGKCAQAGILQKEAAKIIGVSRISISLWGRGRFKPTPEHEAKIKDFLKLHPLAVKEYVKSAGKKKGRGNGTRHGKG